MNRVDRFMDEITERLSEHGISYFVWETEFSRIDLTVKRLFSDAPHKVIQRTYPRRFVDDVPRNVVEHEIETILRMFAREEYYKPPRFERDFTP